MWQWITSPERAPEKPAEVEIGFEGGTPVSIDGKRLNATALLEGLNAIAAANGVGRIDLVENRLVGIKSRGAYETPGGTLLVLAHRELEALCLDRETAHYSQILAHRYAELVYYGLWFTALREALDALLPSDIGNWVERARTERAAWRRAGVPFDERRPLLLTALNQLYEKTRDREPMLEPRGQ